jgi:pyruvate formate lyase activating enzyme
MNSVQFAAPSTKESRSGLNLQAERQYAKLYRLRQFPPLYGGSKGASIEGGAIAYNRGCIVMIETPGMPKGIVFDIKRFAIHDGPGIRTTVFLKGCPLDCWWCHNPEGRHADPESMEGPGGNGIQVTVGREMTVAEVMQEIERDVLFYDESGGGVTFSGGEPLQQADLLSALLADCRRQSLHTVLDTSGYAAAETIFRIAPLVDLFLYDLKLMDDGKHRTYTGASNAGILENLRHIVAAGRRVVIRFPLIPGINDGPDNLEPMAAFLMELNLNRIDLLPYHRIHRQKFQRLGCPDRLVDLAPPGEDAIERVATFFTVHGFSVRVGG